MTEPRAGGTRYPRVAARCAGGEDGFPRQPALCGAAIIPAAPAKAVEAKSAGMRPVKCCAPDPCIPARPTYAASHDVPILAYGS